jgi:hypothetical protein
VTTSRRYSVPNAGVVDEAYLAQASANVTDGSPAYLLIGFETGAHTARGPFRSRDVVLAARGAGELAIAVADDVADFILGGGPPIVPSVDTGKEKL